MEFNLNTWLQEAGYQRFSGEGEPSVARLAPDTRAFALDPSRIYFNRRDRFPDGCLREKDIPALIEEISHGLLSIRCRGEPVVQRVICCADIYSGPFTHHGPDLIVLTHYGFDAKGALGKEKVLSRTDLKGMHTWDDAFFWASEKVADGLNIVDLAPMIESVLSR